MAGERIPRAIIEAAYEAYDKGDAAPADRLAILMDTHNKELHDALEALPDQVAHAVLAATKNGTGHTGFRRHLDKVPGQALTRGGITAILAERLFQLIT